MKEPNKPKPAVRTAFKSIQPSKPVTIAPPIVSTVTEKRRPVLSADPDPIPAPTEPRQIVDIGFYFELAERKDRDAIGWIYFAGEPRVRRIVIVLNLEHRITKELLLNPVKSELVAFVSAWILIERLRGCHKASPGKEVFFYLKSNLITERVSADNDWLAARLSARIWFAEAIAKAPIYGANQGIAKPHLLGILPVPLSPAAINQPWKLFPPKKQPLKG